MPLPRDYICTIPPCNGRIIGRAETAEEERVCNYGELAHARSHMAERRKREAEEAVAREVAVGTGR